MYVKKEFLIRSSNRIANTTVSIAQNKSVDPSRVHGFARSVA